MLHPDHTCGFKTSEPKSLGLEMYTCQSEITGKTRCV